MHTSTISGYVDQVTGCVYISEVDAASGTQVDVPYGTLELYTSVTSTASINNLNLEAINKGAWKIVHDSTHGWILEFQYKYQRLGAAAWHDVKGAVSLSSGEYLINGNHEFNLRRGNLYR